MPPALAPMINDKKICDIAFVQDLSRTRGKRVPISSQQYLQPQLWSVTKPYFTSVAVSRIFFL